MPCGPLGTCNSVKAVVTALQMGLRELRKMGIQGTLKGDSSIVIGWALGMVERYWKFAPLLYEIKELETMLGVSIAHVLRDQNIMADKLANLGIGMSSSFVGCDFPDCEL